MQIEQKYQKLTDIEHCLLRPGMWIGTTSPQTENFTVLEDGKFVQTELNVSPAFIKIFDEIISNSADEHKRNPKLNKIEVQIDQSTGKISIFDNGGIPVVQHKEHKEWIPQMIFSNLRAGSNFNDSENRTSAGLHGVGATLTNIFSNQFIVETCDGKNSYYQEYSNNMKKISTPIIKLAKRGFTKITFFPELKRFGMTAINDATLLVLQKRAMDIAATNPKLSIVFNDSTYHFKTFEEYIKLYTNEYFFEESKDWKIGFAKSENGFQNVSFVNSVHTKDGGTHVEYITNQLISQLREMIKKKHRIDVKPSDIRNHLYVFIDSTIVNSFFSSQTKEKLITEVKDFGTKYEVTDKLAKLIFKSEIIQSVLDWVEKKELAQERAELRKLNKDLDKTKIPKLIDAQKKGDRGTCILGIYEGLCLEENTEVLIFSDTLQSIKIKDISIGDFVISHENKLEQVYQVSKRIDKCIKINLKNNTSISCTEDHRFFVFNKLTQSFDFVKASNIKIEVHQFLKNRLIYLDKFHEIIDITETDDKFDLMLDVNTSIIISKDTKLCIFNRLSSEFKMILPDQLELNNHLFVSFRHI
jgi:DNA topoisomerase-2